MKGIKNYTLFILMNFIILVANAETYIVTADKLNVRSEASKTGDIIETFQQGDAVTVEEISGDWATVDINGEKGYVSTQYLASSESGQKSKETKKKSTMDTIGEYVFGIAIILFFVATTIMVPIRKLRRKVHNFKTDVKDGGFSEATMSRLEDWVDESLKKHNR